MDQDPRPDHRRHRTLLRTNLRTGTLDSSVLELDTTAALIFYEEYTPYRSTTYQAVRADLGASARHYRYTGKERDEESGLYYHGARYYAPWLSRWTSPDPGPREPGESAAVLDQPYVYVQDRPTVAVDPDGRFIWFVVGVIVALALDAGIANTPERPDSQLKSSDTAAQHFEQSYVTSAVFGVVVSALLKGPWPTKILGGGLALAGASGFLKGGDTWQPGRKSDPHEGIDMLGGLLGGAAGASFAGDLFGVGEAGESKTSSGGGGKGGSSGNGGGTKPARPARGSKKYYNWQEDEAAEFVWRTEGKIPWREATIWLEKAGKLIATSRRLDALLIDVLSGKVEATEWTTARQLSEGAGKKMQLEYQRQLFAKAKQGYRILARPAKSSAFIDITGAVERTEVYPHWSQVAPAPAATRRWPVQ